MKYWIALVTLLVVGAVLVYLLFKSAPVVNGPTITPRPSELDRMYDDEVVPDGKGGTYNYVPKGTYENPDVVLYSADVPIGKERLAQGEFLRVVYQNGRN